MNVTATTGNSTGSWAASATRGLALLAALAVGLLPACEDKPESKRGKRAKKSRLENPQKSKVKVTRSNKQTIEIAVAYSVEINGWMGEAIDRFNSSREAVNGKYIVKVRGGPVDSAMAVRDIVRGVATPHLWIPASELFRTHLNQAWEAKFKRGTDIAPAGPSLASTPVVLAMWKPMAEALGWPEQPSWSDLHKLATAEGGWASLGKPEWGDFKLGQLNPEPSSAGALSLLSAVKASAGSVSAEALAQPTVRDFVRGIEGAAIHYSSLGDYFAKTMLQRGTDFLHAAVVTENLVYESYKKREYKRRPGDIVALYPSDGTYALNFPLVVLDATWVAEPQREAAQVFTDFLLGAEVQNVAMNSYGLRPGKPATEPRSVLTAEVGVDTAQPAIELPLPEPSLLEPTVAMWREVKKPAEVVLLIERSGQLAGQPMDDMKRAADDFLSGLDDAVLVGVLPFNDKVPEVPKPVALAAGRAALDKQLADIKAEGGNALRDAIAQAHASFADGPQRDRIRAIVALVMAPDENSAISAAALSEKLGLNEGGSGSSVPVFVVSFGARTDIRELTNLTRKSGGDLLVATAKTVRAAMADLAHYF